MHVEFHSRDEDFHLRISWVRILRIRIDDCEDDSIRVRIDFRIVIRNWTNDLRVVIRDWIDDFYLRVVNRDFEYSCSDFDEYSIRIECVFLIKNRLDKIELMKMMIEMLKMMMTMIIKLKMIELKMIVICFFEFESFETISRMLFQLFRFDSAFSQRDNHSSRLYT
jgi:hypothetical protein